MAFRRLSILVLLLAVAGGVRAAEPAVSASEAARLRMTREVTRFGFEEASSIGPGRAPLPGEWERHCEYLENAVGLAEAAVGGDELTIGDASPDREPGHGYMGRYPEFLTVEVVDTGRQGTPPEAVHGGRRAVRMSLAGSSGMDCVAIKRRIPLEVDPSCAYELTGWVRLEGIAKPTSPSPSQARLAVEWLDAEGHRVGLSFSDQVTADKSRVWTQDNRATARGGWVPIPEFRVNEVPAKARAARVYCLASGREPGAWASFDDIEILRRPKISDKAESRLNGGIFGSGEEPELRLVFKGLSSRKDGPSTAGYVRVVTIESAFGGRLAPIERTIDPAEIREGEIEDTVKLSSIKAPGAYAVQITLQEVAAGGRRTDVAKRIFRLVKLGPDRAAPELHDGAERDCFGVDLDLYGPEAAQLKAAVERLGVTVLAPRLWRRDADPSRPVGGESLPEEILDKQLRDLVGRRKVIEGVLAPEPRAVRKSFREWSGAKTLWEAEPDRWEPLLKETAGYFQQYLSSWRLAEASDRSFVSPGLDRTALADRIRVSRAMERAPNKVMVVPLPLESLGAPAPKLTASHYRELICVPPEPTSAGEEPRGGSAWLAGELDKRFPSRPAEAMAGRSWFLQLPKASENLSLDMTDERRQAQELAREVTLLAAAGAKRYFVELADPRCGLLGPDLSPRPAFAAYRTLAMHLTGAAFLGELDLAGGVKAYAFERGGEGLVVFWSDDPNREAPCQLGARGQAEFIDLAGAARHLRASRTVAEAGGLVEAEMVPISPMPAILTGLEPDFIRTRLGFRLAAGSKLESRYDAQSVKFEIRNYFKEPMSAQVFPLFPQGSSGVPKFQRVSLKPNETATVEFMVRPSFVATVGAKDMTVDLKLDVGQRSGTFTIARKLSLESAISLVVPEVKRNADGRSAPVQVHTTLRPEIFGERKTDVEVSLVVPGAVRQRAQVTGVVPGTSRPLDSPFIVPLGPRPQTVYVGARERTGRWFANVEVTIPAAERKP